MSASREKRLRKTGEPAAAAEKKKGLSKTAKWIIGIVCVILAAAIIVLSAMISSTFFNSRSTAVTVGEHKITPAEYSIVYRDVYYQFYQEYGGGSDSSLMPYLTTSIANATVDRLADLYAIYDEAVAAGKGLTSEQQQTIDETVDEYKSYAELFGMPHADDIFGSMFGAGCTEEIYRQYLTVMTVSNAYSTEKADAYQPSADELESYYTEHQDEFDTVSYRQFYVVAGTERTIAEAKAIAEEMAAASHEDEAKFSEYAVKYAAANRKEMYENNPNLTRIPDVALRNTTPITTEWLSDHSRVAGDTQIFADEDDAGYYVVYFIARDGHQGVNVANVRMVTLSVDPNTAADADWDAAKKQVEEYLAEYLAGEDKSEAAFAALADEHNTDGSVGGLWKSVYPDQLGDQFDAWLFDETRTLGDTAVLQSDTAVHAVYFVDYGETFRSHLARQELNAIYEDEWMADVREGHDPIPSKWGMRFVETDISTSLF